MGIRGLYSYIQNYVEGSLEWHKLCNCKLIIDGNNLAYDIYSNTHKINSSYGGDYDKYGACVEDFFRKLIQCKVEAIVVMDGGHASTRNKFETLHSRLTEQLHACLSVRPSNQDEMRIFPLFGRSVFISVVQKLGIDVLQCDFEADDDIVVLAKQLGAYVLSNDSDFYLFNVPFILLHSVNLKHIQKHKNDDGEACKFIPCYKFNAKTFCNTTQIREELLPLLAPVLGNDYTTGKSMNGFYFHIAPLRPTAPGISSRHKLIMSVIKWLSSQKGSCEEVLDEVVNWTSESKPIMKRCLTLVLNMYFPSTSLLRPWVCPHETSCPLERNKRSASSSFSSSSIWRIDFKERSSMPLKAKLELSCTCQKRLETNLIRDGQLPEWFVRAYRLNLIPPMASNILNKKFFFAHPQIEMRDRRSIYLVHEVLIKRIRGILWTTNAECVYQFLREEETGDGKGFFLKNLLGDKANKYLEEESDDDLQEEDDQDSFESSLSLKQPCQGDDLQEEDDQDSFESCYSPLQPCQEDDDLQEEDDRCSNVNEFNSIDESEKGSTNPLSKHSGTTNGEKETMLDGVPDVSLGGTPSSLTTNSRNPVDSSEVKKSKPNPVDSSEAKKSEPNPVNSNEVKKSKPKISPKKWKNGGKKPRKIREILKIPALKWIIRKDNELWERELPVENVDTYKIFPSLFTVGEMTTSQKREAFYRISNLNIDFKEELPKSIEFILLCICCWKNRYPSHTHQSNLLAVLMCVIMFFVVDGKLGRVRSKKDFEKIDESSKKVQSMMMDGVLPDPSSMSITALIQSLTVEECQLANLSLYQFHQVDPMETTKTHDRIPVHNFSEYQATVYFLQVLNGLLYFPFPMVGMDNMWSGTFCYNVRKVFASKLDLSTVLSTLFYKNTRVIQLFVKLYTVLAVHLKLPEYVEAPPSVLKGLRLKDAQIRTKKKLGLRNHSQLGISTKKKPKKVGLPRHKESKEHDTLENPTEEELDLLAENKFSLLLIK